MKYLASFIIVCAIILTAVPAYMVGKNSNHVVTESEPEYIFANPGGRIDKFLEWFGEMRKANRKVIVDGMCLSACTIVVTMPEYACITPRATLGFHSGWTLDEEGNAEFAPEGTRMIWHLYPEKLRELLKDKYGWDGDGDKEHPNLIYPTHEELLAFLPAC